MEIFDGHTHFFSRESYELRTRPAAVRGAEIELTSAYETPPAGIPEYTNHVVSRMNDCGVDRAVTYASIPQETEAVGEAALGSSGRLVPYVMVNPVVAASFARIKSIQSKYGFRGMLLCPHMHEYNLESEEAARALNVARKYRMVVFLHCGFLRPRVRALFGLDPTPPPDKGQPAELAHVARKRSNQVFVVSHVDPPSFDEMLSTWELCPNVYLDTGGMFQMAARREGPPDLTEMFGKLKEVFGVERVLYGSDSSGFPPDYLENILNVQIEAMKRAGYTDAEREAVLGVNLNRVLDRSGRGTA